MDYFLPFYPSNSPKHENFKKMKKTPGDVIILHKCNKNYDHKAYCSWDIGTGNWKQTTGNIIILHKCTKNHDQMQHCSWDMAHDGCNCYFSFWVIFCTFIPLQPKKRKFRKNENNPWKCHHFTQVYQKLWSYCILFLRYGAWQM